MICSPSILIQWNLYSHLKGASQLEGSWVKGGYDQDGTPLYHGVATLNGIKIPGSISHRWYVL